MRPNLKICNIYKLTFSTTCVIPKEIQLNLKSEYEDSENIFHFYDSYTIDRISHLCTLTLQSKNKEKGEFFIEFEYSITKKKVLIPKDISKIGNLIDSLCTINSSHNFSCSANIEFSKKDKKHFIIDLPIKISSNPFLPFNIIDGFSIEGRISSIDYSTLIWTPKKMGDFSIVVVFSNDYIFDKSIIQNIINDSNTIIDSILPFPEQKSSKKV